jgi:hypothetical protein
MTSRTAYIDMEFAGIYGTRQEMQIPIEIGVVIHQPDTGVLSFAGKAFSRFIDVELWKNSTDGFGKRVGGQRLVFNLADRRQIQQFDKKFHLGAEGRREASRAIAMVSKDLRSFMRTLNPEEIGTLVFFARRREMEAFADSRIRTDGFIIRDLQDEIRSRFHLKEHVSLDRLSLITEFGIAGTSLHSTHFTYGLPKKYRYLMKPHKAIGDAARIFLGDCEFLRYPEEFGERLQGHLLEYENRRVEGKTSPDR